MTDSIIKISIDDIVSILAREHVSSGDYDSVSNPELRKLEKSREIYSVIVDAVEKDKCRENMRQYLPALLAALADIELQIILRKETIKNGDVNGDSDRKIGDPEGTY